MEALIASIIDHTHGLIWVVDEQLNLTYTNKNIEQFFSLTECQTRHPVEDKIPEEIVHLLRELQVQVFHSGDSISKELTLQTQDGNQVVFHLEMFPVEGEKRMVGGYAIKLKHASKEKQLKQTNERLLHLIQVASNAIWEWDIKTGKTFKNQSLLDMIGCDSVNRDGLAWWLRQIHPDDAERVSDEAKEVMKNKEPHLSTTYRLKCKDGTYKHVANRCFVTYEYGFPVKLIGSLRDITEIKKLEKVLAEERLAKQKDISENVIRLLEKERTLIGHELHDNINQILSVVRLYIGLLHPASEDEKEIKSQSLEQLGDAMEDIRNLSRELVIPRLKTNGLIGSIKELISHIDLSNSIKIHFSYDHQTYPISSCKKVTLYRIVQEQVRNIIAYSKATTAKITLNIIENDVQLVIQDNGIGFDPRKKNKGIGLLNIQERTLLYGGTVEINTAEREGCRIIVKIPIF